MDYKTVKTKASAEITEKRSRFIGQISPVTTEREALDFIESVKAANRDARHNIFAFVLKDGQRRCSDDGEPQGTAGIPALDVLLKNGVTDTAIVVTRYFGGILLGAPGLVRAYTKAAKLSLDAAGFLYMRQCDILKVITDYGSFARIQTIVYNFEGQINASDFGENVSLEIYMPVSDTAAFLSEVSEATLGRGKTDTIGTTYINSDSREG